MFHIASLNICDDGEGASEVIHYGTRYTEITLESYIRELDVSDLPG